MIDRIVSVATVLSAIGAALTAGVMLAFSVSVMPGLRTLPPAASITSMQSANTAILNPVFLLLFVGTALSALITGVLAPLSSRGVPILHVAGALLFVVGCFVVTMVLNVPLNDALATVDPAAPSAAAHWDDFAGPWTVWNNVRTVAAVAASASLLAAAKFG